MPPKKNISVKNIKIKRQQRKGVGLKKQQVRRAIQDPHVDVTPKYAVSVRPRRIISSSEELEGDSPRLSISSSEGLSSDSRKLSPKAERLRRRKGSSSSPVAKESTALTSPRAQASARTSTGSLRAEVASTADRRQPSYTHSLRQSYYILPPNLSLESKRRSATAATSSPKRTKTSTDSTASPVSFSRQRRSLRISGNRHSTQIIRTPFNQQTPKSVLRDKPAPPRSPIVRTQQYQNNCELWDSQIKEWLKHSWKLCYMSSMTTFDITKSNLRTAYQNTLRNLLSDVVPFTISVSLETVHCFSRNLDLIDGVSLTVSYSVPVMWHLQSTAASVAEKNSKNAKRTSKKKEKQFVEDSIKRTLYRAVLIKENNEEAAKNISTYPLLFYSGREMVHLRVLSWLQDSFSCFVCARHLSSPLLMWVAGLWFPQPCAAESNNKVTLHYELVGMSAHYGKEMTDNKIKDISKLTVDLLASDLHKLMLCCIDDKTKLEVTPEQRDLVHCLVHKLIHDLSGLPVSCLRLLYIKTVCLSITSTGFIRITCRRHLREMINVLLTLHREGSLLDQVKVQEIDEQSSFDNDLEENELLSGNLI